MMDKKGAIYVNIEKMGSDKDKSIVTLAAVEKYLNTVVSGYIVGKWKIHVHFSINVY